MKKEYDFSDGARCMFYRPAKIQKSIRLEANLIEQVQSVAVKRHTGLQALINNTFQRR